MTGLTPEQRQELLQIQHTYAVRHEPMGLIWMPEREQDPFPRLDFVAYADGGGVFVSRSGTAQRR